MLNGIKGLLDSKKGTLSLLVLLSATVAVLGHRIDGPSYATIITVIASIYNFVQHRIDCIKEGNNAGK